MGYRKIGNWSHDIAVAGRVSHRVAVMYLDEIVEMGPHSQTILRQSAAPLYPQIAERGSYCRYRTPLWSQINAGRRSSAVTIHRLRAT